MQHLTLINGVKIPQVGLGTWLMKNKELIKAVNSGISIGYVGIDVARDYGNEKDMGDTLFNVSVTGVSRRDLFITTKIGNMQQRNKQQELLDIDFSLRSLRIDYIDLLLMHWPYPDYFIKTWKIMEEIYKAGKTRAIGVCNFRERHLKKLFEECEIKPMVNQIEIHPLYTNKSLVKYCQERDIVVEAYCPLGLMDERIKSSKTLKNIAERHGKSIAQVILRWDVQQGLVPIPKSSSPERLRENVSIFDFALSEEEMAQIDSMNIDYKMYVESFYCPGY